MKDTFGENKMQTNKDDFFKSTDAGHIMILSKIDIWHLKLSWAEVV